MKKKLFSTYGGRRREIALVAFIILAAFFLRYWHITSTGWVTADESFYLGMQTKNSSVFHFSDADFYEKLVDGYLENKTFDIPFAPPFTQFLLIAGYSLFGKNYFALKIVYALIGSLSLVSIYITARELFGKETAILTITLCAASFTLIFITGGLNIENVYLFTVSLAAALFVLLYRERGAAQARPFLFSFVFGFSAGAAALTRSEFTLVLAVMLLFIVLKKGWDARKKARVVLFTLLGCAVLLGPWTIRNYVYMKDFNARYPAANLPQFVPMSLNGPFNFAEGHHPAANGSYSPAFAGKLKGGYHVVLRPDNPRQLAYVRDGYRMGWEYIKNNPARELKLVPVKVKIFLDGFANGFMLNNFPAGLKGKSESMADSFVPDSSAPLVAGLFLFFIGCYAIVMRREAGAIRYFPLVPLGAVLLVTLVFYGLSRLAYPVLPYYYMVISAGSVYIAQRWRLIERLPKNFAFSIIALIILVGFIQSRSLTVLYKKESGPFGKFEVTYKRSISKKTLDGR